MKHQSMLDVLFQRCDEWIASLTHKSTTRTTCNVGSANHRT
uniref:Transposase n=1 Tax=Ascaris lumbricoides TaxID=6252 RepID=A0A0M3I9N9_ASCLU